MGIAAYVTAVPTGLRTPGLQTVFSQLRAVPRCVSPRPSGDHHADRGTTRPYLWPRSRLRILFPCLTSHSSRTHRSPERRSTHELLPYPKPAVHLPGFPSSHDTVSLDVDDNVGAIQRHLVPAQSDLLICKTIPGRHMEFHTVPRADDHFAVMDPLRLPACALIGFERAGDDASPGSSSVATWQESVPRRTRVSAFCTDSAAPFTGTLRLLMRLRRRHDQPAAVPTIDRPTLQIDADVQFGMVSVLFQYMRMGCRKTSEWIESVSFCGCRKPVSSSLPSSWRGRSQSRGRVPRTDDADVGLGRVRQRRPRFSAQCCSARRKHRRLPVPRSSPHHRIRQAGGPTARTRRIPAQYQRRDAKHDQREHQHQCGHRSDLRPQRRL